MGGGEGRQDYCEEELLMVLSVLSFEVVDGFTTSSIAENNARLLSVLLTKKASLIQGLAFGFRFLRFRLE